MRIFQSTVEKGLYLVVVLLLTIGIVYGFIVQQKSERIHDSLVNNCRVGNDFRKSELSLWTYILTIPPSQPPTPDQQAKIDAFKLYINKAFALRDCNI